MVEVADFAVGFEMLHSPSCCDLNTEGFRLAYSECEPVLRDIWAKVLINIVYAHCCKFV
jgi:hypothetical protein